MNGMIKAGDKIYCSACFLALWLVDQILIASVYGMCQFSQLAFAIYQL